MVEWSLLFIKSLTPKSALGVSRFKSEEARGADKAEGLTTLLSNIPCPVHPFLLHTSCFLFQCEKHLTYIDSLPLSQMSTLSRGSHMLPGTVGNLPFYYRCVEPKDNLTLCSSFLCHLCGACVGIRTSFQKE